MTNDEKNEAARLLSVAIYDCRAMLDATRESLREEPESYFAEGWKETLVKGDAELMRLNREYQAIRATQRFNTFTDDWETVA